jgi:hypothetical protein
VDNLKWISPKLITLRWRCDYCDYISVDHYNARPILPIARAIPASYLKLMRCKMSTETVIPGTDEDIDGCDCPIDEANETPDEDLPAADGGVE